MVRGQHPSHQREGLQGELTSTSPHIQLTDLQDALRDSGVDLMVPQVCDLKEKMKYQFQVRAANMAGVGIPSLPSDTFLCEEWTIAVPGWLDR